MNYGIFKDNFITFKQSLLVIELLDLRQSGTNNVYLIIRKTHESCIIKRPIYFQLKNNIIVVWEKSLTINEVLETIKEIDEIAVSVGLKIKNKRIPIINEKIPPIKIMPVKAFIEDPDRIMLVPPKTNADNIIVRFDRPEFLSSIKIGGFEYICLKSEKNRHKKELRDIIKKKEH